jgi:hypothetical protein
VRGLRVAGSEESLVNVHFRPSNWSGPFTRCPLR